MYRSPLAAGLLVGTGAVCCVDVWAAFVADAVFLAGAAVPCPAGALARALENATSQTINPHASHRIGAAFRGLRCIPTSRPHQVDGFIHSDERPSREQRTCPGDQSSR